MTKAMPRKVQQKIDLTNLTGVASIDQIAVNGESRLPTLQSSLSFTYENTLHKNVPMTK
jgi:hypothetical protein